MKKNTKLVYVGKDLEVMCFAKNYHNWILEEFRPFIGKKVIEVGAGTGSFSRMLLGEKLERLELIEPSEMFEFLIQNILHHKTDTEVVFHNSVFTNAVNKLYGTPDTIVYVNVLEHIEDDLAELRIVYDTLAPGGHCLIFVPSLMALYSDFDKKIGHFRRYSKKEIEAKVSYAGFNIIKSNYFDFIGMFPWYIKYKLLRYQDLGSSQVINYDKFMVPLTKAIERILVAPLGKNLIVIARK